MRIRTITGFYNPMLSNASQTLGTLTRLVQAATSKYIDSGYDVQTTRMATNPFPYILPQGGIDHRIARIQELESEINTRGFDYISFGPALPDFPDSYSQIPELLSNTKNSFFSGVIASPGAGIHLDAVHKCGEIIAAAAKITPDGFTNLRFSALANVSPFGPFFPGAYHQGDEPAFSLAIESADLAINAFSEADSMEMARDRLLTSLEHHASKLHAIAEELSKEFGIDFKGMDFSLAPFPEDWCSLGGAIEQLGVQQIGLLGSVAAAAFVADTLDRGKWLKAGFNGLMLPVLEDSILAQRTIDGTLSIKDLLLYSTVCGTGLDTVPLPGDATAGQLSAILADIAALSTRLNKPLTGRLMPVPGKTAGELTEFDFEFFKNGRILELPAVELERPLSGSESFMLSPRYK
ncbi:MAG: DUF711 family protein [Anaerolineaceae bacterium]|nr:DUF711 family protein [Anaerolineaceae bacterium]